MGSEGSSPGHGRTVEAKRKREERVPLTGNVVTLSNMYIYLFNLFIELLIFILFIFILFILFIY